MLMYDDDLGIWICCVQLCVVVMVWVAGLGWNAVFFSKIKGSHSRIATLLLRRDAERG